MISREYFTSLGVRHIKIGTYIAKIVCYVEATVVRIQLNEKKGI